jgi:transposase
VAPPERLIADKAYTPTGHATGSRRGAPRPSSPRPPAEKTPYPLGHSVYKRRNVTERLFRRLKNWRRIATRYDRLARNFLSAIAPAEIVSEWAK